MNVWTYWEGDKPPFIDVCLRSMQRVCHDVNFHIVTPDTINDYLLNTLNPRYLQLPQPALRADAIRAALLATYGGWWWDADTIALQSPTSLPIAPAIYMTWTNPPRRILNGYIYLESTVAKPWLDNVNFMLESDFDSIDWCSLGEKLLTDTIPNLPGAIEIDRSRFLPIDIDSSVADFFSSRYPSDLINDNTICFGLNYSWFMYHHRKDMLLPQDEWKNSPLLIHKLLIQTLDQLA
jgi:hypothetical protein